MESPLGLSPARNFRTFSRFNRDELAWVALSDVVLWRLSLKACGLQQENKPERARAIQCWSCGCSSGEEPYYLRMIWQRRFADIFPELGMAVLGTDVSCDQIDSARDAVYEGRSMQGLPLDWQNEYFEKVRRTGCFLGKSQRQSNRWLKDSSANDVLWKLRDGCVRWDVRFLQEDVTERVPSQMFDLILSRYAVCLYLDGKSDILASMVACLMPGAFLMVGQRESVPETLCQQLGLVPLLYNSEFVGIYQKVHNVSASLTLPRYSDVRAAATTLTVFLESSGRSPDWRTSLDDRVRDRPQISEHSRAVLAKSISEGRRMDVGVLSRMKSDQKARRERADSPLRSSNVKPRIKRAQSVTFTPHSGHSRIHEVRTLQGLASVPKEEVDARICCFIDRMAKDAYKRGWTNMRPANQQSHDMSMGPVLETEVESEGDGRTQYELLMSMSSHSLTHLFL